MSTAELTCKEVVEIVTDYLEGKLPAAERVRLEDHLRGCPGCRTYLEQMRQTIRIAGKLSEEHISPEAETSLLKVFTEWKNHKDH